MVLGLIAQMSGYNSPDRIIIAISLRVVIPTRPSGLFTLLDRCVDNRGLVRARRVGVRARCSRKCTTRDTQRTFDYPEKFENGDWLEDKP